MFPFVFTLLIIWVVMWGFFKFMYPKPPKAFMPQEGDITTARHCDLCDYPLAEYRGVLEEKPEFALTSEEKSEIDALTQKMNTIIAESDSALQSSHMKGGHIKNDHVKDNHIKDNHIGNNNKTTSLSRKEKKALAIAKQQYDETLFGYRQAIKKRQTWFFCNYEHQAEFHEKHGQSLTPSLNLPHSASEDSTSHQIPKNDAPKTVSSESASR